MTHRQLRSCDRNSSRGVRGLQRPFTFLTLEKMTRTELLDAASEMLTEVALLLDEASEETAAHDAVDLAEVVNSRILT